ncbi:glycoside hydrolase family 15 protein [Streptomyces mirabilis]|uniref:glycoside hydrolase family 15 protein n=1 Tax=Streptomyces mirabilis TaxID=68239 RepID=UPI0021BF7B48|nr:glycoside hydrolase family 15 protein [Streptomyces mirabilis]MCT9107591.1 glycoside hydrolase family 15 protein [Streptomyces mirabilis]
MAGRIEDYALIGDLETAALIGRDGTVAWMCLPRFDSGALFAELLGTEDHGFWHIGPATTSASPVTADRRRYRGESLILETEWDTPTGTVRVTDHMPPRTEGAPRLVRIVEAVCGTVSVASTLSPRFNYGRTVPWIRHTAGRTVCVAGPESLWLDTPVPTHGTKQARSEFTLTAGERVGFTLSWQASHASAPRTVAADEALEVTERFWRGWVAQCTYQGPHRTAVVRSLITLKALTYAPTGGIVAAPTTSLPEDIGGVRNWDYRYVWLRDAALGMSSLLRTGFLEEARAWREWLLRAIAGDPENLQIMYGVAGERDLGESELDWLPGYEESAPVRVGNGAAQQLQLDVYGEVIEFLYLSAQFGLAPDKDSNRLLGHLLHHVETQWRDPDEGIWEIRGPRRHFVHSKVMAWAAVDRAVRLIEAGHAEGPLDRWRNLRTAIHADVCAKGFDRARNTFTQSYGSAELDAALLMILQTGFLPPDDKRVIGTVEAIQRELSTEDGFLLRYLTSEASISVDGLPGDEGEFLVCSFWLADALAKIGRVDEAFDLFEKLLSLRNDVGLLAEEWNSGLRRQVGNFPQLLSHIGMSDAALTLSLYRRSIAPQLHVLAATSR